jgi:hypothetical protein
MQIERQITQKRLEPVEVGSYFGWLIIDDGGPTVVVELMLEERAGSETVIQRVPRERVLTVRGDL